MYASIAFPDISPTLIDITLGPVTLAIRWYALAYIGAVVVGMWIVARAIARPQLWADEAPPLTREQLDEFLTWLILGIILGGRLGYVLVYDPAYFAANPLDAVKIWQGGMSFHGGFLGVATAAAVFSWLRRIPPLPFADALAMATPPGLLLGRIANFINAELWGRPTDLPWGVVFPGARAQDCPGIVGPCARHPSQLYEAGMEGLILGTLLLWFAFRRGWLKRPGAVVGLFMAGYGLARFLVEFVRVADAQFISADHPLGRVVALFGFGLSMGQLLSLPMILLGLVLLVRANRRAA